MKEKFYFTFGTSEQFPFKKGWVEVVAEDKNKAVKIFNSHFPPVNNGIVNCAFIYDREDFEETEMFTEGTWGGCHSILIREQGEMPILDGDNLIDGKQRV